jgi:hypothetical protein
VTVDLSAASAFVVTHARLLDRRRFDLLLGRDDAGLTLAALDGYRNADGGYGWGLEPDLRAQESQPIHALHVFEILHECGAAAGTRAVELCDWLETVSFDDGGLPFVLPIADPAGCAPWFADADSDRSSLHGTAAVVSAAWRVARHDTVVAAHPWLVAATRYCLDGIADSERLSAYELVFLLRLLDALHDTDIEAADHLAHLTASLPSSGLLPAEGGVEGEVLRPLDYAPDPGSPIRARLADEAVDAELDRLVDEQRRDGGWEVDFASFSPAGRLEWRGYATLRAVGLLVRNGRLRLP